MSPSVFNDFGTWYKSAIEEDRALFIVFCSLLAVDMLPRPFREVGSLEPVLELSLSTSNASAV